MSSFKSTVDVTAQTTYPTTPQVDLSSLFEPNGWVVFAIGTGDAIVAYSLDGVNDHGNLKEGTAKNPESWTGKERKVWLRKVSGNGTITVDVQAKN